MLRLHLAAHPDLSIPPECSFLSWLHDDYADWSAADVEGPRLDLFLRDLSSSRKFHTWKLPSDVVKRKIKEAEAASYASLVSCVYEAFAENRGKAQTRWGDKNNVHIQHLDLIGSLFPAAQYVILVRDVRDVFASFQDLANLESQSPYRPAPLTDPREVATLWRQANLRCVTFLEELQLGRAMLIKYEELASNPVSAFAEILAFLEMPWTDAIFEAPEINRRSGLEPPETLDWKPLTLEPITTSRIGRWRESVSPVDLELLLTESADAMSALGYRV